MLKIESLRFVSKGSLGAGIIYYDHFSRGTFYVRGERLSKEFYFNDKGEVEGPGVDPNLNEIMGIGESKDEIADMLTREFHPQSYRRGDRVMFTKPFMNGLFNTDAQSRVWRLYPGPIQEAALFSEISRIQMCYVDALSPLTMIHFLKLPYQQGLEEFELHVLKSTRSFESYLRNKPLKLSSTFADRVSEWKNTFKVRSPVDNLMKTRNDIVRGFFNKISDISKKLTILNELYSTKEKLVEQLTMDYYFQDFLRAFHEPINFYQGSENAEARVAALIMEAFSVASKLSSSKDFPDIYSYSGSNSIITAIQKEMTDFVKEYKALIAETQTQYKLPDRTTIWTAEFTNNMNRHMFKDELVDNIQDFLNENIKDERWRMRNMYQLLDNVSKQQLPGTESVHGVVSRPFRFMINEVLPNDIFSDVKEPEIGYFASVEFDFKQWGVLSFRVPYTDALGVPMLKKLGVRKSLGVFRKLRIGNVTISKPEDMKQYDVDGYLPRQYHPPTFTPESIQMVFTPGSGRVNDMMMLSTFLHNVNYIQNALFYFKTFTWKAMLIEGNILADNCPSLTTYQKPVTLQQCAIIAYCEREQLGSFAFHQLREISLLHYVRMYNPTDIEFSPQEQSIFFSDGFVMRNLTLSNSALNSFFQLESDVQKYEEQEKVTLSYFNPLFTSAVLPFQFSSYYWLNERASQDIINLPETPMQRLNNTNELLKFVNVLYNANHLFGKDYFRLVHFKAKSNYS